MIADLIAIVLHETIRLFEIVLFVNIILSWFVHSTPNMAVRNIYLWTSRIVDPLLDPIRRLLRPYMGGMPFDISPMVLYLFLNILGRAVR
ncbi:MAG: YggT family protein [Candidatus Poribacteria bacterium]|jgi:uncharacterized protein YggT (Ycf19 family)|nr:YggT family protein [Candidatus Poribacteria bacterium]